MDESKAHLVPIPDDEMARSISIILAAHSERFPQLRGPGIKPHEKDDKRHRFADELVSRLRQGGITFFRRVTGDALSQNSKWFSEGRR